MLSRYDNAKQLWDDLHEQCSMINIPRIHPLKCEQTKTMYANVYYSKLCVLCDELYNYEPITSCTCGQCKCKCNLGNAYEK